MIYGYNPTVATKRLRYAYKFIAILLMVNNIAGIALNPGVFLISILLFLGIPGACFTIHYTVAAMRKEPFMFIIIHPFAILYNIFIYWIIAEELHRETIGGVTWPTLNIILSVVALIIAVAGYYHSRAIPENNSPHHLNN